MSDIDTVLSDWIYWKNSPPRISRNKVVVRLVEGRGYLAGKHPEGITTIDKVPSPATIRVLLRSSDQALDGVLISKTKSNQDGTWRVDGLNPNLRYDVVGRSEGFNDVIVANVQPELD